MKHITFYFDFVSPYAYLAFEKLPEALQGLGYSVTYKPVLLAGLLQHHGTIGPAEVPPKRDWMYRQVLWLAHTHQVALQMPASHPFNPLALLRLAVACGNGETPNRYVTGTVFRHVWQGGADVADAPRQQALVAQLAPALASDSDEVKAQLRAYTDEAMALGIFGVPTFAVDGKLFWGLDALPMLRAYLEDDAWFDGPDWAAATQVGAGVVRR